MNTKMAKVDLVRFESAEALAQTVAREWVDAICATSPRYAALSGGRITEKFFDEICKVVRERNISLREIHFFWADERCVPPDHPESNYRVTNAHLLAPLGIPAPQVHRIKGELGPAEAAREASQEYRAVVREVLDFVFLGMGEDGHIASIFPGDTFDESPTEQYRPVFAAPKPPPQRVTLAMQAVAAARNVWVVASGAGKEQALGNSLRAKPTTPLGWLVQRRDLTRVFTDIPGK